MTDGPGLDVTPRVRRRRRRAVVALALAMLLVAGIAVGWWRSRAPLSDEERRLVGTWTYQWDNPNQKVGLEYEFRADRTCVIRNYNPDTGAVLVESAGATWWLSGDKLIVRHPGAAGGFWRVLPSQRAVDEVSTLTPDGPDRFRYTGTIETGPPQPPVTGTMTRVRPAP